MLEIKKILYPCNLEESSSKILAYVVSIAEKYNSMIYLLHVVQDLPLWCVGYIPYSSPLDELQHKALEASEKAMDRICEEQLQGCSKLQRRAVGGDPATEILKTIETEDVDLVIMGTHGREGLDHAIFGSVAEKTIRKSPAPVLIINPYKRK